MATYKSKQYLFVLLKLIVVFAALGVIIYKLTTQEGIVWADFKSQLLNSSLFQIQTVLFVVLLSVFNWFFELLKWQVLAKKLKNLSLFESAQQVLTAHTTSIFTPLKMGEYGAKTVFFDKKQAKKVLFLNFLGNMAQMTTTVFFGIIGGWFYVQQYFPEWSLSYLLLIIGAAVLLLFIKSKISLKSIKISTFSLAKIADFLGGISPKDRFKIVGYSLLRYLAFSLQFAFLLSLLASVSVFELWPLVFAMYLLSSLLPVMQLFDFAVKGGVAVLIFSTIAPQIVVSVALLMWLLNAVFPALVGMGFVLSLNTKKLSPPYPPKGGSKPKSSQII